MQLLTRSEKDALCPLPRSQIKSFYEIFMLPMSIVYPVNQDDVGRRTFFWKDTFQLSLHAKYG